MVSENGRHTGPTPTSAVPVSLIFLSYVNQVMPVIKAVAYNFVTERCPGEVMALGINTIREICKRIPALLEEEGMDFLVQVS